MGRLKKYSFKEPKMFSSRIEMSDFFLVEKKMFKDRITLQDFINGVVQQYISGTIFFSGSQICYRSE